MNTKIAIPINKTILQDWKSSRKPKYWWSSSLNLKKFWSKNNWIELSYWDIEILLEL